MWESSQYFSMILIHLSLLLYGDTRSWFILCIFVPVILYEQVDKEVFSFLSDMSFFMSPYAYFFGMNTSLILIIMMAFYDVVLILA